MTTSTGREARGTRRPPIGVVATFGLGLLLIVVPAAVRMSRQTPPAPGMLVAEQDERSWDGPTSSDAPNPEIGEAEAEFVVANRGGTTVRITAVESSCGCTTARARPEVLEP